MTLWQRIKGWFSRSDDFEPDDTYPHLSTGPIPDDLRVPGMDTWKREMDADTTAYFRRVLGKNYNDTQAQQDARDSFRPSYWDRLSKRKHEQATQDNDD